MWILPAFFFLFFTFISTFLLFSSIPSTSKVAVYLTSLQGTAVGLPLAFAIAAHNIPEGMAVAAPIYHATGSKWLAFKW